MCVSCCAIWLFVIGRFAVDLQAVQDAGKFVP